jgi:hypothetical protein
MADEALPPHLIQTVAYLNLMVGPKLKKYHLEVREHATVIAEHLGVTLKESQRNERGLLVLRMQGPTYLLDKVPSVLRHALIEDLLAVDFTYSYG